MEEEIQSTILSEGQVDALLDEDPAGSTEEPEVKLPSEEGEPSEGPTVEELQARIAELEAQSTKQESTEPSQELVADYVAKYQEQGGELSETDYKELAEKGYSKEFVDTYIEGMNAKVAAEQQARVKELAEPYGGESVLQEAIAFARDNWSVEDKKAFNESVTSKDPSVQKLVIASLMREYNQSKSTAPVNKPLHTNTAPQTSPKGYETKSDMMKDMADPRYRTDASFNAKVQEKLMNTDQSKWYSKVTSL